MNQNLRFIFTGGPGAGKTTTLHRLEKSGYACVPEVARQIIHDRKQRGLPPRPAAAEFARAVLAERDQSFGVAVRTAEQLRDWYETMEFSIIEVPRLPAPERAAFIIQML